MTCLSTALLWIALLRCTSAHIHHAGTDDRSVVVTGEHKYGDLYMVFVKDVNDNEHPEAHKASSQRRLMPMWRDLSFEAKGTDGELVKVDLTLERVQIFSHDAVISGGGPGSEIIHERSYRGSGEMTKCIAGECEFYSEIPVASVTFFREPDFDKHTFNAVLRLGNEEWTVEPRMFIEKEKFANGQLFTETTLGFAEPAMYMFQSSETFEDESTFTKITGIRRRQFTGPNLQVFTNCFPGQGTALRVISMGMLIDNGFYAVSGNTDNTVTTYVAGMMNNVNAMYRNQMQVEIRLSTLQLRSTTGANGLTGFTTATFNEGPTQPGQKTCPSQRSASTRLTQLRLWRGNVVPTTHGLWHLMTHCHPAPGTVGIAYVGALCQSFGVGLSNWLGTSTWEVVAHELGHNFGSGHTFDALPGTCTGQCGIMDYGDGLYLGIYQFHPTHKNEVCNEISSSLTQRRAVANCWTTENTTPAPANGDVYAWAFTGDYGPCSGTCSPAIQEQEIVCVKYDLDNCSTTKDCTTLDCSSCSANIATVVNGCQFQIQTTTANCQQACKPTATVRSCSGLPTCTTGCGNGVWEEGEYCDTANEPCCINCAAWSTSASCQASNPTVDASFIAYSGQMYMFQGPKWTVYDTMFAPIPSANPRLLSSITGLDAAFHNGIDAVVSFYDSLALLFKGENFVLVDMAQRQQRGNIVYSITTNFGWPSTADNTGANACGNKIDAVITHGRSIDFMCKQWVSTFSWSTRTMTGPSLINDYYGSGRLNWPGGLTSQVSAANRNPRTNAIRIYAGNQNAYISPSGAITYGTTAGVLGPNAAGAVACAIDNCASCSPDGSYCQTCDEDFKKVGRGICKSVNAFAYVTFDDDEGSSAFYKSGDDRLGELNIGSLVTTEGAFGNGASLNGQQILRMEPVTFENDEPLSNWKVSLWWKPTSLGRQRLFTFNRVFGEGDNAFTKQFIIYFTDQSDTEPVQPNQFAIEIDMYGAFYDCYVERSIGLNQWNKISFEFLNGELITAANGLKHTVAMNGVEGTDDLRVEFKDWFLGAPVAGLQGDVDNIEVTRTISPEKGGLNVGLIVGITITCLALVGFALGAYYYFYRRPKVDKRLTERAEKEAEMQTVGNAPNRGVEVESEDEAPKPTPSPGLKPYRPPPRPKSLNVGKKIPPRPKSGAPPVPRTASPSPSPIPSMPPPVPGQKKKGGKKKAGKGKRAPPRPKKMPPPPGGVQNRSSGRLDLGMSPDQRRESWQI